MRLLCLYLIVIALAGCANVGVVEVAPGTYILSKQDNAGMFGNFARFKTEVIQEANDFAKTQGKVAIPVTMNETPAGPGRFATFQYQFRLAEPNDLAAQRVILSRQPDLVVESKSHNTTDVTVHTPEQSGSNLYEKLLKLDELRKRGILTDTEFEAEKEQQEGSALDMRHLRGYASVCDLTEEKQWRGLYGLNMKGLCIM